MKKKTEIPMGALFYPMNNTFDNLFIPYIYKEIYFDGVYTDILNAQKDMVIVDVGANVGIVTDFMRKCAKKIYSIEPATANYEALVKNKEFNKWDNVETFKLAIADKDDEMVLYHNNHNSTSHSLTIDFQQGGEVVKTMRMDTFFKENKIDQVDFMKFDVEGAEDIILRSDGFKAVAGKIKSIMIEFHHANWQELVEHMIGMGYQARRYESSAIIVLFTRI